ncbi:MAG: polysaccharide biosynthesis C-terminal domain-containing protein, partial [Anaerolineae bacterium]|nr:polysaccharide biosynthesis C-terminal domain-containing protein [Anaerolineae bacterium]
NSVISFTFTMGLNLVLIPLYGLMGAAVVALVATITLNSLRLVQLYVMYRLQPYNITFLKPIIAGGLTLLAMYAGISTVGLEKNIFFLIVAAPILILIYAGLIFLLGLSAEDRTVLDRLQRRVVPRLPWRKNS